MRFNEAINLKDIEDAVSELYSFVESMEEFGHCVIHSDAEKPISEQAKDLIDNLELCKHMADNLNAEMIDWYGY